MRVIAGEAGSIRLVLPKGAQLRPTSDAVREALFSSLADEVRGARFLDVYAGTGAVGIEALSRGAASCVFVERDRRCVEAIRRNLQNTRLADRAVVSGADARRAIARVQQEYGPYDIVFIDPPYDDADAAIVAQKLLVATDPPGLLIYQHSKYAPPAGLPAPEREQAFGETLLSWYRPPAKGSEPDVGE
jgi:16S rRNA (guanine966-N2)-methyltransferase